MNLLEAYSKRLTLADKIHAKAHQGEHLTESKKILIAKCLENTQRFMAEAFEQSQGTQRSDMGLFTKFSLNLVNVALPNLIAPDLVLTHPMSSMTGYINYVKFVAGSNKGNVAQGDVFNDPFRLGKVDPNYTSSRVAKDMTLATETTEFKMDWKPVIKGTVAITAGADKYVDDGKGKIYKNPTSVSRRTVMVEKEDGRLEGVESHVEVVLEGGTEAGTIDYTAGTITLTTGIQGAVEVAYTYNNVVIPQNDLPLLSAKMEAMPLLAKARRIAIYYSQIAAFQAKTDYGMDLGDQLAEKAVGQLAYEIDTEVVKLLSDNAAEDAALTWSKTLPVGVSKAEHYEGFVEMVGIARQKIYDKTQRFLPNYMIISSSILPILGFIKGWTAAPATAINGPYFAGTLDGLKVYVSPAMAAGRFVVGVNDNDFMSSAAVYAPYMPIVPTQLLGHADGSMSQGWSTLYDLKILNKDLLVAGKVVQ